jgi:hypothetical protein
MRQYRISYENSVGKNLKKVLDKNLVDVSYAEAHKMQIVPINRRNGIFAVGVNFC